MRALVAAQAVIALDTLEEWLDVAEFFTRFPVGQAAGPSVITDSGALRGLSLDFADSVGLPLPELSAPPSPGCASASRPLRKRTIRSTSPHKA